MSFQGSVLATVVGVLFLTAPARSQAGGSKDAVKRIEAMNAAALASYQAGDAEKARSQLMEAVVFGKESDLDTHPVMAKTYLNLALIHTEGLADEEKGKRYLSLARRINPKITIPPELAEAAPDRDVVSEAVAEKEKKDAIAAVADASDARLKEKAATARAEQANARERSATQEVQEAKQRERAASAEAMSAAQRERKTTEERDRLMKDLAAERDAGKKARDDADQLRKKIADTESELARTKDAVKKERDAKEQLQKTNADNEKQLAELRQREKNERDARQSLEKELVSTKDREAKERAARESLEKEKLNAQAKDKERKAQEELEQRARERLAEGPDLPAQIPQPVFCPIGDEAHQGDDLFVHCAAQPNVKAKGIAFYYRTSGSFHFNSLSMDRSKKGWFVVAIPRDNMTGKVLQYYAEAIDGRGDVVAANGKPSSPNIVTLRSPGVALASAPDGAGGKLSRARMVAGKRTGTATRVRPTKDRAKTP
jgi:hypothetical protein